jgi:hypothetical protein
MDSGLSHRLVMKAPLIPRSSRIAWLPISFTSLYAVISVGMTCFVIRLGPKLIYRGCRASIVRCARQELRMIPQAQLALRQSTPLRMATWPALDTGCPPGKCHAHLEALPCGSRGYPTPGCIGQRRYVPSCVPAYFWQREFAINGRLPAAMLLPRDALTSFVA